MWSPGMYLTWALCWDGIRPFHLITPSPLNFICQITSATKTTCLCVSPALLMLGDVSFFVFSVFCFPRVTLLVPDDWAARRLASVCRRRPLTSGPGLMVIVIQVLTAPVSTTASHVWSQCLPIIWRSELLYCPVLTLTVQSGAVTLTDVFVTLINIQVFALRDGHWIRRLWYVPEHRISGIRWFWLHWFGYVTRQSCIQWYIHRYGGAWRLGLGWGG